MLEAKFLRMSLVHTFCDFQLFYLLFCSVSSPLFVEGFVSRLVDVALDDSPFSDTFNFRFPGPPKSMF